MDLVLGGADGVCSSTLALDAAVGAMKEDRRGVVLPSMGVVLRGRSWESGVVLREASWERGVVLRLVSCDGVVLLRVSGVAAAAWRLATLLAVSAVRDGLGDVTRMD